jgi:hypothetical protein
VTTVLRLIGMPVALWAAATSCAVASNWASVYGSVPAPEHSIDSYTHSLLDVAVPDYDINPGVLLPVLGAICALLGLEASAVWRGVK